MSQHSRKAQRVIEALEQGNEDLRSGKRSRSEIERSIKDAGKNQGLSGLVIGIVVVGCIAALVVGVGLLGTSGQSNPTRRPNSTPTRAPASSSQTKILFSSSETYHLGDEYISGWYSLWDTCININFDLSSSSVRSLSLQIEVFGAEAQNLIYLNGYQISHIEPQGTVQPNYWSGSLSGSLSTKMLVSGRNTLSICSAPIEVAPEFSGDLDDFQIRNITLTVKY